MVPQIIISGLLLGGVYGCVAVGFSLITGVLKIFNFSHGAFIMLGAYSSWYLSSSLGIDPFLILPFTMIILFIIGFVIQRYLINRVIRAPLYMTLILTFGLDMVIINSVILKWTGNLRSVRTAIAVQTLQLGSVRIPAVRFVAFIVAITLSVLLYYFMNKARTGKAITATRMDLDAAKLSGIDSAKIYAITFGIGASLAGAAGNLISMISSITPTMGAMYSSKAFAICILGGFGHMAGALVGGLLMGMLEILAAVTVGPGYQEAVAFAVLVIVLVIRPKGILGREYY